MEPVLGVEELDFDPSLVTDPGQLSAEEFLLYVRYEAEQCPGVVRATVDSSQYEGCQTEYMPKIDDIPSCNELFLPSCEWENEVVESFSRFRLNLSRRSEDLSTRERKQVVPLMKDESSWFKFCLGGSLAELDGSLEKAARDKVKIIESLEDDIALRKNMLLASLVEVEEEKNDSANIETGQSNGDEEEGEVNEESDIVEYDSAVQPTNRILLQFDQVLTQRLLDFLARWLKLPFVKSWNDEASTTNEGHEDRDVMVKKLFSWIFSLLSRLEKPLYMDTSATVRDIYRTVCTLRADLAEKSLADVIANDVSDPDSTSQKRVREDSGGVVSNISQLNVGVQKALAIQNTVIVICGKYFGQEEIVETPYSDTEKVSTCNVECEEKFINKPNFHETVINKVDDCPVVEQKISPYYSTLVKDEDLRPIEEAYKLDGDGDY